MHCPYTPQLIAVGQQEVFFHRLFELFPYLNNNGKQKRIQVWHDFNQKPEKCTAKQNRGL
jgi:hypothetical protein